MLGHVISSYHEAQMYLDNDIFNFLFQVIYSFHMALFMVISGYLSSIKNKHKGNKKKQILQLLVNYGIPYIIFSLLWAFMKMMLAGYTNTPVSLKDILYMPIYPISFMWFIYALLIMQILHVLIEEKSRKFKRIYFAAAVIGYGTQSYLEKVLYEVDFTNCIWNDFLKFYLFFLIGAYFGEIILKKIENIKNVLVILTGMILLIGNVILYVFINGTIKWLSLVISLMGCLFIIILSQKIKKSKILAYCGKNSLPIYVLQGFVIAGTRIILTRFGLNNPSGTFPLLACTIAGCLIPLVVYEFFSRIWKLEAIFYPGKYIKIKNE